MTYKQIKHLILWIPTITIGLWEYVRHSFLLPYISMDLGNLLAPVLVFLVTITLLRRLFGMLEETQEKLHEESRLKSTLQEREKLAQELHDGISQSLFMLSVKVDQLEASNSSEDRLQKVDKLRQTIRYVYEDVRQAIANLQTIPEPTDLPWFKSLTTMIEEYRQETGMEIRMNWTLSEEQLTSKEKIELFACVREALVNVQKHAQASVVWITCEAAGEGFNCSVKDNGKGYEQEPFSMKGRYGLKMMKDRAGQMGWSLTMARQDALTIVEICKGRKLT